MVKYGKQYRELQVQEWAAHYIDYKALKHFIKENNDPSKIYI